jgi:Protein of Unknown function (DUF2784)
VPARLLADAVVVVHLVYLAFIPLGGWLGRHRPRLIPVHLLAVAVGLASVTIGFDCPLTGWEQALRRAGGEPGYGGGFVDHYLTGRLFPHGADHLVQLAVALACIWPYRHLVVPPGLTRPPRWRRL